VFEIGNSLHEARVRRSIDFNQAEQATKIRVKYLRALEDERFEQLPSQTYVKGFLRTYADYLGLDGQLYVDEFNSRFVVGEESEARLRRSTARPERRTRRLETSIVLLAVAVVGIITLVVISAWQMSGSGSNPPRPPLHPKAVKHPKKIVKVQAFLEIEAVGGASYVAVHRGGGPTGTLVYDGTIEKGQAVPFKKGKHFWLDVSSPENLHILVGGKLFPLSGGKPLTLTVTPSGVHTN
jgi:hypothetical protein